MVAVDRHIEEDPFAILVLDDEVRELSLDLVDQAVREVQILTNLSTGLRLELPIPTANLLVELPLDLLLEG